MFSWPGENRVRGDADVAGRAWLFESEGMLTVRFSGLLGDARRASWRAGESVLDDFALRSDNLTLGLSGVNTGDCNGVIDCAGAGAGAGAGGADCG